MLDPIRIECLIDNIGKEDSHTIFICSPNYEERSTSFPTQICEAISKLKIPSDKVSFRILNLQGARNNVEILDFLKARNNAYIENRLGCFDHYKDTIPYPDGFSKGLLSDLIQEWIKDLGAKPARIVVDISGLPRSVIIGLADVIDDINNKTKGRVKEVFVAYTSAGQYPSSRYPQDIGVMKGCFTTRPLQEEVKRFDQITAVIIPSVQGFEGKLLYDSLGSKSGSRHILLFTSTHDFMTSMKTMRANQSLLQQLNANIRYHFSIAHGVRNLEEIVTNEVNTGSLTSNTLFLIGPFGPKPFAWAACCICKGLERKGIHTEIALSSGFQYTSVYSIGIGQISIFKG